MGITISIEDYGITSYWAGSFHVDVYPNGDIYARHDCSKKDKELWYDSLTPLEMEECKCYKCGELDIPAELQALYALFIAGINNAK